MLKVFVIDDDPVILEVTRAVLENMGHEVCTRDSALGATAMILKELPDIVLVDIELPALSGDELVRLIRDRKLLNEGIAPAFVLYSGARASDLEKLVRDTGALGGIQKTPDPNAFAASFEKLARQLQA